MNQTSTTSYSTCMFVGGERKLGTQREPMRIQRTCKILKGAQVQPGDLGAMSILFAKWKKEKEKRLCDPGKRWSNMSWRST